MVWFLMMDGSNYGSVFMSSRQDYRRFVWIFVWIFPASSGCSTVASRRVRRAITFACQSMVLPIA